MHRIIARDARLTEHRPAEATVALMAQECRTTVVEMDDEGVSKFDVSVALQAEILLRQGPIVFVHLFVSLIRMGLGITEPGDSRHLFASVVRTGSGWELQEGRVAAALFAAQAPNRGYTCARAGRRAGRSLSTSRTPEPCPPALRSSLKLSNQVV